MDKNRLRNAILNATARNAALVIKNANIVNVFTGTIEKGDVAMRDGVILGIGTYSGREEIDANGAFLCPGLIDGHVVGAGAVDRVYAPHPHGGSLPPVAVDTVGHERFAVEKAVLVVYLPILPAVGEQLRHQGDLPRVLRQVGLDG